MDSEPCLGGAYIWSWFSYRTQRVDHWLRDGHQWWACPRPPPVLCFFQQLGWRHKRHVVDSAESNSEHAPALSTVLAWFFILTTISQGAYYHHFHFTSQNSVGLTWISHPRWLPSLWRCRVEDGVINTGRWDEDSKSLYYLNKWAQTDNLHWGYNTKQ